MSEKIAESAERNDGFDACPFCGDHPVLRKTVEEYAADDKHPAGEYEAWYQLCCDTCGFEIGDEYRDELISKWNSRAFTIPELVRDYRLVEALLEKGRVDDALDLIRDRIRRNDGRIDSQGMVDVLEERRRQIDDEGWTVEHDDEHAGGQMARAAACYAISASSEPNDISAAAIVDSSWPWAAEWWKPTGKRRDLVKAGALIVAEIDRLDRAGEPQ